MESMEIDNDRNVGGIKENGLNLYPVPANDSGEGLPYAPMDWPNPGDNWSWKVGKRIKSSGYFADRELYLPSRLRRDPQKKYRFRSMLSVEQYLRAEFPGVDVNAFFASFSWKIPSEKLFETKGNGEDLTVVSVPSEEMLEKLGSDSQLRTLGCKAGNKRCINLGEPLTPPLIAMVCDICCSEAGFCRDCCCIFCCKTINSDCGTHFFIKCEAVVCEGFICGHIAHIECGLRSYLAGTVGGSIGLDAEYYCRRCDSRTDLVLYVEKLLLSCESNKSRDEIEKILNIGTCILRGSQKTSAKTLLDRIGCAMAKLKSGTKLEDIWKTEDTTSGIAAEEVSHHKSDAAEVTDQEEAHNLKTLSPQIVSGNFDHQIESLKLEDKPQIVSGNFDHRIESRKLEDEIHRVLQELRKSQETEYRIAEERLSSHKNRLLNLYKQIYIEKSELSRRTSSADPNDLLDVVLKRVDQIKQEVVKLREMEEVANGFGRTSRYVLKEHFGFDTEH